MKIIRPSPPPSLATPDNVMELFNTEDLISGFHIQNTWLTSTELVKKSLAESLYTNVDFYDAQLKNVEFVNCTINKVRSPAPE